MFPLFSKQSPTLASLFFPFDCQHLFSVNSSESSDTILLLFLIHHCRPYKNLKCNFAFHKRIFSPCAMLYLFKLCHLGRHYLNAYALPFTCIIAMPPSQPRRKMMLTTNPTSFIGSAINILTIRYLLKTLLSLTNIIFKETFYLPLT